MPAHARHSQPRLAAHNNKLVTLDLVFFSKRLYSCQSRVFNWVTRTRQPCMPSAHVNKRRTQKPRAWPMWSPMQSITCAPFQSAVGGSPAGRTLHQRARIQVLHPLFALWANKFLFPSLQIVCACSCTQTRNCTDTARECYAAQLQHWVSHFTNWA